MCALVYLCVYLSGLCRFRSWDNGRARSAHLADPFVKVKGLFMDFINLGSGHWRHNSNVFVLLFEPSHNDGFCCIFAAGGGANCGIRGVGLCVVSREDGGSSCSGCGLTQRCGR